MWLKALISLLPFVSKPDTLQVFWYQVGHAVGPESVTSQKAFEAECKSLVIYYVQRSLPALPHSGKHCLDSSNAALIVLSHGEDCCFHSSWNGGVESVKLHLLLALAQTDLCIIPSSQVWDYRSLPSLSVNAGWCYSSVQASSSLDLILIQLIQALFLCSVIGSGISIFPLSFVWEKSC